MTHNTTFDPTGAAFTADRFTVYRALRDENPVARTVINDEETYVLTRYADVSRTFKTPRARVQPVAGEFPKKIGDGPASQFYRFSLPELDPPTHTRLRKLASSAFSTRAVASMRGWVEQIITAGIDRLAETDTDYDFVAEFATRVPAEIACRLLHAPMADAHTVLEQMPALNGVLGHGEISAETLAAADKSAQFYIDYIGDIVDTLRGTLSSDDAVGALLEAEEDGSKLTRTELIITLVGFFVASYHTTMVAMTNAVYALASHRDQLGKLATNPELAPKTWEEVLRYLSPVHFVQRYAGEDMDFSGHTVPADAQMLLAISAANRDDRFFADPDRFDIERDNSRQLAFAAGGHFCLGAPLSRIEGGIFLRQLGQRLPDIRLAHEPEWGTNFTFPSIGSLLVHNGRVQGA
ncbi:cytochrome P450 [Nocardia sp. NPDC059228]|uniref:cytochrome P450 n=1 Tax=Nocardia sp. NPDC059228 TaxID=3346777 RepID=UPI0036C90D46